MRIQQNTHWYRVIGETGWTSQPEFAAPEELSERGYHDCATLGCETVHTGSALEIFIKEICEREGFPHYAIAGTEHTRISLSTARAKIG